MLWRVLICQHLETNAAASLTLCKSLHKVTPIGTTVRLATWKMAPNW